MTRYSKLYLPNQHWTSLTHLYGSTIKNTKYKKHNYTNREKSNINVIQFE